MDDYTQSDFQAFESTLREMGINPSRVKEEAELPPLPPSDPMSLQHNQFDGFYRTGARDYWKNAQVTQNKIEDFKKCQHYLVKQNNEAICTHCHVGWAVPESFHTQEGKLYENETPLEFSL